MQRSSAVLPAHKRWVQNVKVLVLYSHDLLVLAIAPTCRFDHDATWQDDSFDLLFGSLPTALDRKPVVPQGLSNFPNYCIWFYPSTRTDWSQVYSDSSDSAM